MEKVLTTRTEVEGSLVEVEGSAETEIVTSTPTAEVKVPEFILSSAGLYGTGTLTGQVPGWLDSAITNSLLGPTATLQDQINTLSSLTSSLELGVNQNVSSIQSLDTSYNTLVTTVASILPDAQAAAVSYTDTKVATEFARVTDGTIVGTQWLVGNEALAESYVQQQISSYASANLVSASDYTILTASLSNTIDNQVATATSLSDLYVNVGIDPATGLMEATSGYLRELLTSIEGNAASISTIETVTIAGINDDILTITDTLIPELQSQLDGNIVTWFQDLGSTRTPVSTDTPWSDWIAIDTLNGNIHEQLAHVGDLFYNTFDGQAYRFAYEEIDANPGKDFGWLLVTDNAIALALANAATAQDTADGKRTIYYLDTPPTVGVDIGDMNVNPTTQVTTIWNGTAWVDTTNSTADQAYDWSATASKYITAPDGSITGWQIADGSGQTSSMTIAADTFKIVSSAAWNPITGTFDLGSSQYAPFVVDGTKIKLTGDVEIFGLSGSSTSINGDVITTGKIQSADTNTYFDLTNNQIKMNNDAGFVLNSTAAGTALDPNIEGAYIKGGSIAADTSITADSITAGTLNVDVINSGSLTSATTTSLSGSDPLENYALLGSITTNNADGTGTLVSCNISLTTGGGSIYLEAELRRGSTVIAKDYQEVFNTGFVCLTALELPAANTTYGVYIKAGYVGGGGITYTTAGTLGFVEFKK